jgi:hypothetical protein
MYLEGGMYLKVLPVNTITGATTFNFVLENTNHFYDLGEFLIDLELVIKKKGGGVLDATSIVAFIDNTGQSIFKSVVVNLNGNPIPDNTMYQTHANYMATRLGCNKQAIKIHLQEILGLTGEVAGKNDTRTDDCKGWTIRQAKSATSKSWYIVTSIPNDFFRT